MPYPSTRDFYYFNHKGISMKKYIFTAIIIFFTVGNALADRSDWNGRFIINGVDKSILVEHTHTKIIIENMLSAKEFNFSKGSSFNGIKFKEDVHLSYDFNVDNFTNAVSKIGPILDKDIKLGQTYTVE